MFLVQENSKGYAKMIVSIYWKEDLLKFVKKFRPVKKPPRWSERLQVNFEKEIIIAFFMIRKLADCHKFSPKFLRYKAGIYRSRNTGKVNNLNFASIERLYDIAKREKVYVDIRFLCNQLMHSGAVYGVRGMDRNWEGIYTCSDFERQRYLYFIPIKEVIRILKLASSDYPNQIRYSYCRAAADYQVMTG